MTRINEKRTEDDDNESTSRELSHSSRTSTTTTIVARIKQRFSPRQSIDELRNPGFWNDVMVEMVMCMYLECLLIWVGVNPDPKVYTISITHFGIFAGLLAFVLFEGFVPMSGASMSPARSWAFFLAGRMTFARAMIYSVVETAGCAAGAMIAMRIMSKELQSTVGAIVPPAGVSDVSGMAIEAILTFNLIFVGLVVTDKRTKPSCMPNISIALSIGTGTLAAGSFTGGLQNPAVAFGPAVASGNFKSHWLYWVGPFIGATLAVFFWQIVDKIRYTFDHRYIQRTTKNSNKNDGQRHVTSKDSNTRL